MLSVPRGHIHCLNNDFPGFCQLFQVPVSQVHTHVHCTCHAEVPEPSHGDQVMDKGTHARKCSQVGGGGEGSSSFFFASKLLDLQAHLYI